MPVRRHFISYLLIFIIPLMLGSALYDQITRIIRQDTIDAHLAVLQQVRAVVEMRLRHKAKAL